MKRCRWKSIEIIAGSIFRLFGILSFYSELSLNTSLWGEEQNAHFLKELRRLQLFDVAERYGMQLLARESLTPLEQVDFTVEQMRTYAFHAMSARPAEREPLWRSARKLAADFLAQGKHPRAHLIALQDALVVQTQGEQLRREAEAAGEKPPYSKAADLLRNAESLLDDLAEQVAKELPSRRGRSPRDFEFSFEELTRLHAQLDYQRARTELARAYCAAAESRDRKALLLSSLGITEQSVNRIPPGDDLAGKLRALQMATLRELGRYEEALRVWELTQPAPPARPLPPEALAEAARATAWQGDDVAALRMLEDVRYQQENEALNPELDLARLEVTLRGLRRVTELKDEAARKQALSNATHLAARMEQRHGVYWGRRADQLLATLASSGSSQPGEFELLARQADAHATQHKWTEAQLLYDRAAEGATAAGQLDLAFSLRYKSALATQELKQFAVAAAQWERLARDFSSQPQANQAHMFACWNKAQQVRGDHELAPAYLALLEDHLARWPGSETADQARWWLGQFQQARGNWGAAYEAYSRIRVESKLFLQGLEQAAGCSVLAVEQLIKIEKPHQATARQYAEFFQAIATSKPAHPTKIQPVAILAAATLQARLIPGGSSVAEKLLTSEWETSAEPVDATWREAMPSVLVLTLAPRDDRTEAVKKIVGDISLPRLLPLLEQLNDLATRSNAGQRTSIAQTQLIIMQRLEQESPKITAEQQKQLNQWRAAVLATAGDREAALAAYAQLTAEDPKNGSLQIAYAQLLEQGTDKSSLTAALGKWRQIAQHSQPREQHWYQAKFRVASLQHQLGETTVAHTLVRYLLETPPGIPDPAWKLRFESLLAEWDR